ncbi:MAG TPA: EipA family protein [Hyphomicrobiaceae bacterium]|nr:EipA family protein [Hyphomicrobiaceae bacterium]
MPSRSSALAGALVSLPLLLSASSGLTQETWRGAPPRDDPYRSDSGPRYDDPDARDPRSDPNARPSDAYRPSRPSDAYSPPPRSGYAGAPGGYAPPPAAGSYGQPHAGPPGGAYAPPPGSGYGSPYPAPRPAYGEPYTPPRSAYGEPYAPPRGEPYGEPPPYGPPGQRYGEDLPPPDGSYSSREILATGHSFFGSVSKGLASVVEYAFQKQGRPNGYILGQEAGGAFVAGLRYGEGILYTKDAGEHRVYWQGPSIGWDAGAEGSKVMMLVYNLHDPQEIYRRFGGVEGSAYLVGGVGLTFQKSDDVIVAPIRSGLGLRFGANVGYLKYTRRPTWNPF